MVTNTATGVTRSMTANGKGEYRIANLQPGIYKVSITAAGFAPFQADIVTVTVGSVTDLAPKLGVGGTQEKVVVTDEAPRSTCRTTQQPITMTHGAARRL